MMADLSSLLWWLERKANRLALVIATSRLTWGTTTWGMWDLLLVCLGERLTGLG
jgi:hypothetical protein